MQGPSQASKDTHIRAAEYVRMSTEHQQYSIENQSEVIRRYATAHRMEVVRTYQDHGKSGLRLRNRKGLQSLIRDVESGNADFSAVLVHDVSRWGRFQDTDESAYYEFLCRRAKIQIHYCAEPFENDGSLSSALMKTIKRGMAGEYIRELSVKVFAGKCRLAEKGFRQGGHAGYGLRRLLVDQEGNPKFVLRYGERKSISSDRVILIPGPEQEIAIVREIFSRYTDARESFETIAAVLNSRGVPTEHGGPWTPSIVGNILTNPKYIGANVLNRISTKLSGAQVRNPPREWVQKVDAFTPIVSADLFQKAQEILSVRTHPLSDEELLDRLRQLLAEKGYLANSLLDEVRSMPSRTTYFDRFGGLLKAYKLIGYDPRENYDYVAENRALALRHAESVRKLISDIEGAGASVSYRAGILTINGEFTVSFALARCRETKHRGYRWQFRLDPGRPEDITIVARMAPGNQTIQDYYILPRIDELEPHFDLGMINSFVDDVYRFANLSVLFDLCKRVELKGAP